MRKFAITLFSLSLAASAVLSGRSLGVFAGVSLQGATLRADTDENKQLYGKAVAARDIVRGNMAAPAAAKELMAVAGEVLKGEFKSSQVQGCRLSRDP